MPAKRPPAGSYLPALHLQEGGFGLKTGFDNAKYIQLQKQHIQERISQFSGKLYLEFGGKLFDDYHAARVLPGFDVNGKIRLLYEMRQDAEIIFCISADDIEKTKVRADLGIGYDMEVLRLIDDITAMGIPVNSVVITRYTGQSAADAFARKLTSRGVKNYIHRPIEGYPADIAHICSDEGYGANPYIETTRPIVVVTAPGPGSGKLATCLSQLYHEYRRGVAAGYSKFETFPVWNVPLKHPLNIAYEAATADLKDVNMIDSFHLEAFGEMAVNYNRDLEMFPVLRRIIEKITGKDSVYRSPTQMGVNRVGFGIIDDQVVREASRQEVIRRYFKTACDYKKGYVDQETFQRVKLLMDELDLKPADRSVVLPAREYALSKKEGDGHVPACIALEMPGGRLITGKTSRLMSCCAAVLLNAVKELAGLHDEMHLLAPVVLEPMVDLKARVLGNKVTTLSAEEILMALSICAATNPTAQLALDKLGELRDCQAHSTAILTAGDEQTMRKLGIDVTCDPEYATENLYYCE